MIFKLDMIQSHFLRVYQYNHSREAMPHLKTGFLFKKKETRFSFDNQ